MDYESIMEKIQAGLTGEIEKDRLYLTEQMNQYRDHEFSREILRECGRMLFGMLPGNVKEDLSQGIRNDLSKWTEDLEKAQRFMVGKNCGEALKVLIPFTEKLDGITKAGMFQNDSVSEYYCFDEPFQEALHRRLTGSEKTFRTPPLPFARAYALCGTALMEVGRYREAQAMLEKARRWNPASSDILFEDAEACKMQGGAEEFLKLTRDAFRISYRPASVARCFRNLGWYFAEKKMWNLGAACLVLSLQYEPDSPNAQNELEYIEAMADGEIHLPDFEEFRACADQYDFPTGESLDVLRTAREEAFDSMSRGELDEAEYYLRIDYDLTEDEKIRAALEEISGEKEAENRIRQHFPEADYFLRFVIRTLPASEEQIDGLLQIAERLQEEPENILQIVLPGNEDPEALYLEWKEDGFRMFLQFPMDDFDWEYPLVLEGEGIPFEETEAIIRGILLEGKSTDQFPVITDTFREISTQLFGEQKEENNGGDPVS